jgi:hypothetical protein
MKKIPVFPAVLSARTTCKDPIAALTNAKTSTAQTSAISSSSASKTATNTPVYV